MASRRLNDTAAISEALYKTPEVENHCSTVTIEKIDNGYLCCRSVSTPTSYQSSKEFYPARPQPDELLGISPKVGATSLADAMGSIHASSYRRGGGDRGRY